MLKCDLQVRWLHNNVAVSGPHYELLSDEMMHALHIAQVAADDAGTFTVVANNSLGTASHSARLKVDLVSLLNDRQRELDGYRVNGIAEPAASVQQWHPASRHSPRSASRSQRSSSRSPRSSECEQPVSSRQLKTVPGM